MQTWPRVTSRLPVIIKLKHRLKLHIQYQHNSIALPPGIAENTTLDIYRTKLDRKTVKQCNIRNIELILVEFNLL
jgi:hypothetical protein